MWRVSFARSPLSGRKVSPESQENEMPKGYVILTEDIHDREGMDAYGIASGPSMIEFGGRPLIVDENVEVLEGEWHGTRTVVIEYESVEKAREWYNSASYQAVRQQRHAAADSNVIIASGWTR